MQFNPKDPEPPALLPRGDVARGRPHLDDPHRRLGDDAAARRSMDMEIAGHEFWSWDGRTIWFDLQTPRSEVFWIAGVDIATGKETRYHVDRDAWSVHYNVSRDDSLFMGDGGDETQVAFSHERAVDQPVPRPARRHALTREAREHGEAQLRHRPGRRRAQRVDHAGQEVGDLHRQLRRGATRVRGGDRETTAQDSGWQSTGSAVPARPQMKACWTGTSRHPHGGPHRLEASMPFFAVLPVALIALLAYAATRPNTFRIQRSQRIAAPPKVIASHIDDFREWAAWSPYEKLDPADAADLQRPDEGSRLGLRVERQQQGGSGADGDRRGQARARRVQARVHSPDAREQRRPRSTSSPRAARRT